MMIFSNKFKLRSLAGVLAFLFLFPSNISAQTSMTLSVTPPLFRLNIEKGESWSSSLRIVNNNPYDITVYPTVVNFEPEGEGGQGKFIPILDGDRNNADLLANWVKIETPFVVVPKEQSVNIPFTVRVPNNASPGGHYAAILTGTKPPAVSSGVGVSSFVTSLLLVKVGGEVIEQGVIREFSTDQAFYKKQEVSLNLRFENTGNVHIIPRGDITIYNMWGSERGKIDINKDSDFGNVLPESIRKFNFSWKGNDDQFEIGRYTAVLSLAYGTESQRTVTETIGFWVIPLRPTMIFVGSILGFALFMGWAIRSYVRRAMKVYKRRFPEFEKEELLPPDIDINREVLELVAEPLRTGITDLRRVSSPVLHVKLKGKKAMPISRFWETYKNALLFIGVSAVFSVIAAVYLIEVRSPHKDYSVSTDNRGSIPDQSTPSIKVISSHATQVDAKIGKLLESNGFKVGTFEKISDEPDNDRIIIRFVPGFNLQARLINQILGSNSIVEEVKDQDADIVIIVPREE